MANTVLIQYPSLRITTRSDIRLKTTTYYKVENLTKADMHTTRYKDE